MTDIVARLEASLDLPELPESAKTNARELFENLARPVTVCVLGSPGSGKTALINLFLRERLIPEGLTCNLIEIVPGDDFVCEVSFPDGRLETLDRDELEDVQNADRVLIASENPVLKDMVLIEASGSESPDDLPKVIDDASSRSDLALWCTYSFKDQEYELWQRVDERLRDHAFLVLTRADKLARKRKLADALANLKPAAERDFAALLPVATLQALKALDYDPIDEDLWAGSGAEGLIKNVTNHVRRGRQADLDQAELFLARYATLGEDTESETGAKRSRQSRPTSEKRQRSRKTRDVAAAQRAEAQELGPDTASPPEVDEPTEAVASEAVDLVLEVSEPDPAKPRVKSEGLAQRLGAIRSVPSQKLLTPNDAATDGLKAIDKSALALARLQDNPMKVLNLCADTADELQDVFESGALPANLVVLRDEILQAQEHLTLLQLESTAGAAADAVTLLLQLKRDLQAQRVA